MISIRQPLFFTEVGQKENQEDSLYPLDPSPSSRVFVLCDGMGGHDNGEVASATVSKTLGDYLSEAMREKGTIDINIFKEGLAEAYKALDQIDTNSVKKPGTTMTCLCLNDNSYLVAHIGDSRIYHIRPSLYNPGMGKGGIIYKSSDHSLVNDLLKAGELTKEQARTFPHKNVITRAMQPHLENPYKADAYIFSDIQPGDYFFMCCDGVLERLTNRELCRIIADPTLDDEGKLQAIKNICDGKTKDNYTCWLIPVDNVDIHRHAAYMPGGANAESEQTVPTMAQAMQSVDNVVVPTSEEKADARPLPMPEPKRDSSFLHILRWLTDAAVLLMLLFSLWLLADTWREKRLPDDQKAVTDTLTEKEDTAALNNALKEEEKAVEAEEQEEQKEENKDDNKSSNEPANQYYDNPKFKNKPSGSGNAKSTQPEVNPSESAPEPSGETTDPGATQSSVDKAKEGSKTIVQDNVKENTENNNNKNK